MTKTFSAIAFLWIRSMSPTASPMSRFMTTVDMSMATRMMNRKVSDLYWSVPSSSSRIGRVSPSMWPKLVKKEYPTVENMGMLPRRM